MALLETILSSELTTTPWTATGERVSIKRKSHFFRTKDEIEEDEEDSNIEHKELSKSEIRRLKKEKRKKEWEELLQVKPGDDYEDPEEVAAIEKATQQMGDYKLKTSSDYVVSEEQRMSTAKKQRELIICRNTVSDKACTTYKLYYCFRYFKLNVNTIRNSCHLETTNYKWWTKYVVTQTSINASL